MQSVRERSSSQATGVTATHTPEGQAPICYPAHNAAIG